MNRSIYKNLLLISLLISGCQRESPTQPSISPGSTIIIEGTYPTISPNGQKLAFLRNNKIFISDTNGMNVVQITPDYMIAEVPQWSYDGNHIGFVQIDPTSSYKSHLVMVDIETKQISSITGADTLLANESGMYSWSWSPDNNNVAVLSYYSHTYYTKIIKVDGSGSVINKYPVKEFCWNGAGTKLICSNKIDYSNSPMYIATLGNDSLVKITSRTFGSNVTWLPNRNVISFIANSAELIYYDLDSKVEVRKANVSANYKFSPDVNQISYIRTYHSGNPDADMQYSIVNLNTLTNDYTSLVSSNRYLFFNWAPNSKEIFYGFNGNIYKTKI